MTPKQRDQLRIVLFQSRSDITKDHELECILAHTGLQPNQITVVDTLYDPLSFDELDAADGVIFGGSGECNVSRGEPTQSFDALVALVQEAVRRSIPTFGICHGGHLLAHALGGTVEFAPETKETGSYILRRLPSTIADTDSLYAELPQEVYANCGRTDNITALPPQAVAVLSSELAPFHAFVIEGKPVYGVQHHPELDKTDIEKRMRLMNEYYPGKYFTNEEELNAQAKTVRQTPEVTSILRRFIDVVVMNHMPESNS